MSKEKLYLYSMLKHYTANNDKTFNHFYIIILKWEVARCIME